MPSNGVLFFFFRPDLIAYEELIPSEHIDNLNNAFNVADEKLGIHKILDAEGKYLCT